MLFENLFGEGTPLPVRFLIAFVVVLLLIAATFWLIRRFGADRLGGGTARGRQPRLAVIDATAIDGRRRLVLIRRDNVEHLVMIGGPSDIVVEQNIVRAVPVAPSREMPGPARTAPGNEAPIRGMAEGPRAVEQAAVRPSLDAVPRTVTAEDSMWSAPIQPDMPARAQRPRGPMLEPDIAVPEPIEPLLRAMRPPEDVRRPAPPPTDAIPRPPRSPDVVARPQPTEPAPMMPIEPARPLRPVSNDLGAAQPDQPPPAPISTSPAAPAPHPPAPPIAVAPPPPVQPESRPTPPAPAASDANLADMAQRLEAALRRPISGGPVDPRPAAPPWMPEPARPAPDPARQPERDSFDFSRLPTSEPVRPPEPARSSAPEPKPVRPEPKPDIKPEPKPSQPKTVFDSLEEEMASLLGRPKSKE